ncbi:MAG: tRNA lysidine(34) synthetase TilS [Bacteroidota bacterium]
MQNLLQNFKDHIHQQGLFIPSDRLLIAVSGGLDSMTLAHLCLQAGYTFALAHCNFQLRGAESDGDAAFLEAWAKEQAIPFYSTTFKTLEVAEEEKSSIQLVARRLRYDWLEQMRHEHQFQWILTAHHLNDSIETFLYNFTKGCGIRGLHGIPQKNGLIVRPLLFASREQLIAFAKFQHIQWREDSSNASDKYARNQIRHHVVPTLQALNPAFEQSAQSTIQRIQEAEHLYHWAIQRQLEDLSSENDTSLHIDFVPLLNHPARNTILFEGLQTYGFNGDQIGQLLNVLDQYPNHKAGKQFLSKDYQLIVDRKTLVIDSLQQLEAVQYELPIGQEQLTLPDGTVFIEQAEGRPGLFYQNNFTVCLDMTEEAFPLIFRHWRAGDFFHPLGMKGKTQKLQDFYTHQKLNRIEKDRIWVVENAKQEIIWIVGLRIDHHFRIKPDTKGYFVLSFKKN